MQTTRVLIVAATTGYQTRAFEEAAGQLGVRLQYATDRCHVLADPWRDAAIPVRFDHLEESTETIARSAERMPIDGVLAVGDAPAVLAALAANRLGLAFHSPGGALAARDKFIARERLAAAGLPTPVFRRLARTVEPHTIADVDFPCVVKPLGLSGSRGVIRADDRAGLIAAFARVRALLESLPRHAQDERSASILIEEFIPGHEFAIEGIVTGGRLQVLAVFDKPDPLNGPYFEETIYVTPPPLSPGELALLATTLQEATRAMGLGHGPVHAECRVNDRGAFIVEIAARPIGGLCARALRFESSTGSELESLESVLLQHALGRSVAGFTREREASGVMMIPTPGRGVLRSVTGVDKAQQVPHVTDVHITAKADQLLVPLPDGAGYLGFIFARSKQPDAVVEALHSAHVRLTYSIEPELRMVESRHG